MIKQSLPTANANSKRSKITRLMRPNTASGSATSIVMFLGALALAELRMSIHDAFGQHRKRGAQYS